MHNFNVALARISVLLVILWASPTFADPNHGKYPKVDCSDPAYSNLPSCDKIGGQNIPSAKDHEAWLERQDIIRCNKAKLACKKKNTPAKREACLANVDDIC
jgi:hypothetical protein